MSSHIFFKNETFQNICCSCDWQFMGYWRSWSVCMGALVGLALPFLRVRCATPKAVSSVYTCTGSIPSTLSMIGSHPSHFVLVPNTTQLLHFAFGGHTNDCCSCRGWKRAWKYFLSYCLSRFPLSSSISLFHLLQRFYPFFLPSLGDDTKWPTRNDVSLNKNVYD